MKHFPQSDITHRIIYFSVLCLVEPRSYNRSCVCSAKSTRKSLPNAHIILHSRFQGKLYEANCLEGYSDNIIRSLGYAVSITCVFDSTEDSGTTSALSAPVRRASLFEFVPYQICSQVAKRLHFFLSQRDIHIWSMFEISRSF